MSPSAVPNSFVVGIRPSAPISPPTLRCDSSSVDPHAAQRPGLSATAAGVSGGGPTAWGSGIGARYFRAWWTTWRTFQPSRARMSKRLPRSTVRNPAVISIARQARRLGSQKTTERSRRAR